MSEISPECREPDPARFCATSCGFDRTGHGPCKPSSQLAEPQRIRPGSNDATGD